MRTDLLRLVPLDTEGRERVACVTHWRAEKCIYISVLKLEEGDLMSVLRRKLEYNVKTDLK